MKFRALVDVHSMTVFSWELPDAWPHEGKHLPGLLERARTKISEVYADRAYPSRKNAAEISYKDAVPFLRPKKQPGGRTTRGWHHSEGMEQFQLMIDAFNQDRKGWMKRYGRRTSVESVFGAIKRRFDGAVGAAKPHTRRVEACLKMMLWNLSRVPLARF